MEWSTAFTEMSGVRYPIALAPMGGSAGGALAAAVSRAGGLGLLGSANGDAEWPAREAPTVAATGKPWGIGFLTWSIDVDAVDPALSYAPTAVMLSFGDPSPYAERVRRAGAGGPPCRSSPLWRTSSHRCRCWRPGGIADGRGVAAALALGAAGGTHRHALPGDR
ncbi:NAD(P)H-dependent flavin oxidoreductase YrpB (nitropropane dioxygenase family) [Actinomadura coerulea]|uniref:NAD(P)H-dependent flavin oxidoreductase YrpB (Nitropropane dioxygenase family) n=1 Tax=Actinomadura coerulea TaxID=46159 RepID=A0A7X0G6B5_9ACTN|nr:NAD(P)H-dependent flavin oxidoreductase YrpB (nitropropane dioxygenase family) [Actinomadura coerulea]